MKETFELLSRGIMYYYHKEWGGPFMNLTQAYGHFSMAGMSRDSFMLAP